MFKSVRTQLNIITLLSIKDAWKVNLTLMFSFPQFLHEIF